MNFIFVCIQSHFNDSLFLNFSYFVFIQDYDYICIWFDCTNALPVCLSHIDNLCLGGFVGDPDEGLVDQKVAAGWVHHIEGQAHPLGLVKADLSRQEFQHF